MPREAGVSSTRKSRTPADRIPLSTVEAPWPHASARRSPTARAPGGRPWTAIAQLWAIAEAETWISGALCTRGADPGSSRPGLTALTPLDYPGPPITQPGVRMPSQGLGLAPRLRYLAARARRIDVGSVVERAKESSAQHGKWMPAVLVDMLWQAGLRNVGFQDYIDYDFAILSRDERATYMTHPVSNQLSQKYDHPDFRHIFQDKVEFDRVFSEHLHREWMVAGEGNADDVKAFTQRHGTIVTKEPVGQAGTGVHRYHAAEIDDWDAFHRGLLTRGELLIEEVIVQHPDLAAVCPGTVNTTRVTAFFDGEQTHILAMAQKFGRGAVSDQMTFGGFYTMLDDDGKAIGPG